MCLPSGAASALTGCPVDSGRPVSTFQERRAFSSAACSSLCVSVSSSASCTCPPSMSLPTKIPSERQRRYCVRHDSKDPFHYLLDKDQKSHGASVEACGPPVATGAQPWGAAVRLIQDLTGQTTGEHTGLAWTLQWGRLLAGGLSRKG